MDRIPLFAWLALSVLSAYWCVRIAGVFVRRINKVHAATGFYVHFITLGLFEAVTAVLILMDLEGDSAMIALIVFIAFYFIKLIGIMTIFYSFVEGRDPERIRKVLSFIYKIDDDESV